MIKKKVVIIAIVTISTVLSGMEKFKKLTKSSGLQSSQEIAASSEEENKEEKKNREINSSNLARSGSTKKVSVTSLNNAKQIHSARSQFRDKSVVSKSENSSDKK